MSSSWVDTLICCTSFNSQRRAVLKWEQSKLSASYSVCVYVCEAVCISMCEDVCILVYVMCAVWVSPGSTGACGLL